MTFILPSEHPNILKPGQYKTDFFNRKNLYYVNNKKTGENSFVCKLNEAYSLHGSPNLDDVNDAFLASLIDYKPNSKLSDQNGTLIPGLRFNPQIFCINKTESR